MKGVWNKALYIDLTKEDIEETEIDEELILRYLGGNGLGIKLLQEESKGVIEPYSKDNPLIFVPGLLNGSGIPMTEKCGFYSKSPLTGIMAEGIFGGGIGEQVKKAGYDAVVIKGKANRLSYISINEEGVSIEEAEELRGLETRKTEEILEKRHGGKVAVIGPAGENQVKFAIIDGNGRQVGRTGLGAVMGSKNLKGIVVNGWKNIKPDDPNKIKELKSKAFKEFTQEGGEGKESYEAYSKYGTVKYGEIASELGIFPTEYWKRGSFEKAENLSSYNWEEHISESRGCNRCPCRCGQVYEDIVDVEYETSFSLGSNLKVGSIKDVARANYICDELGLDTIEMGNVIGFLMRLSEDKILDDDIRFGDAEKAIQLIRKTTYREDIGNIAAEGVVGVGNHFDKQEIAVHVNGLSPPAYDPRAVKGMGLGFYTSTRGACHLRSDCDGIDIGGGMTSNDKGEWVHMQSDRFSHEDKEYVAWRENYVTLHDTLGSCKLTGRSVYSPEFMSKLVNAYLGTDFTAYDIYKVGERIYNLERLYNLEQKPEIKDISHIPKQFTTPSKDANGEHLTKEEIKSMLKDYYKARGWDEKGVPTKEKLKELNI
ncbi:MAG: aldehyde ferredoxin oxidoreductase family protein [Thermoplasmatota archaeon]